MSFDKISKEGIYEKYKKVAEMFQIVQFGICTFTWRESKESTSDSEENEHEQAEDSNESVDECEVQFRTDNLELRTFEKDMEISDTTSHLSNRTDNFKKRRAEQRNDESDSQSCSSGKSEICGRKRKRQGQGQGQGQGPTDICGEKNKSHGYYEAKPFNFYIFPFSRVGNSKRDLIFGSLNRSLEFLAKNSFDFNKWVYDGISYATLDEITRFKKEKLDLLEGKSLISTSERDLEFLNGFQEKIRSLLSSEGKDSIRIDTKGSYQQRLVHQEIRNYTQLYAKGRKGMVDIFKDTEDYVKAHRDSLVDDVHERYRKARGFGLVMDMISSSKKPLVGHNCLLDLLFIHSHFYNDLPRDIAEFSDSLRKTFPMIIDTKCIIETEEELKKKYQSSVLEQVEAEMERNTHNNQGVRTYSPYDNGTRRTTHEAGYDAFLTGKVFVNLKIDLDHTFRKYSGMFFVLNAESPVLDLHTME